MNRYEPLKTADTDDSIENANRLRNCKKKLRNLEKKPETPGNLVKRKLLKVEIREYEHKISSCKTAVKPSKNKKQQSKSAKEREHKRKRTQADDEYLEQEFQKTQTPEYKAMRQAELDALKRKREAEQKQKQEKERQREEQRQREQQRQREERQREQYESEKRRRKREQSQQENTQRQCKLELIQRLRDKHAPQDIIELAKNYDHKVYRKLSLKYHPDKGGTDGLFKLLGMTKDHFTETQ